MKDLDCAKERRGGLVANQFFQTHAKCCDHVCNLIINSGNSMNVVGQVMVDKLKLLIKKYPPPYKVVWVNDHYIPVMKRCLVNFKNRAYKDSI